jgi:serine/threonine-protein kinase
VRSWPGARPFAKTAVVGGLIVVLLLPLAACGGSTTSTVAVPSVVGRQIDKAVNSVSQAGFTVTVSRTTSRLGAGRVVSQSPAADSKVPKDTEVRLVVSSGQYLERVPDVTGKTAADASTAIQSAGFDVSLVNGADSAPVGTAVKTDPPANSPAPVGSVVEILVSEGPPTTTVPDVVGKTVADAVQTVSSAGFVVAPTAVFSDQPEGQVVAQTPPAGKSEAKGATVQIDVSQGAGTVAMPSLVGLTAEAAQAQLTQLGLTATQKTVPGAEAQGTVVGQDPAPGTTLQTQAAVTIDVSDGTQTKAVAMPSLVGLPQETAETQLIQLGLRFNTYVVPSDAPIGSVVSQDPPPGKAVEVGDTVRINVSGGR